MRVWGMHERAQIKLNADDRAALAAVVANRNSPQKYVWRAKIVLLTADGHGTAEIMRQTGKAKTVIWRWQERFGTEGTAGLLRDKTRPSRIPPLDPKIAERVVALTLAGPPAHATHWTGAAMAKAVGISVSSVQRIWRAHGLQPHRMRQFKLSNDPQFVAKLRRALGGRAGWGGFAFQILFVAVLIWIGYEIVVNARASASEAYLAFDAGAERLAKQLRRYKRRLRDHHAKGREPAGASERATDYVLAPTEEEEAEGERAEGERAEGEEAETGGVNGAPAVIAEMSTELPSLTVGEAAMRMDLAEASVLLWASPGSSWPLLFAST